MQIGHAWRFSSPLLAANRVRALRITGRLMREAATILSTGFWARYPSALGHKLWGRSRTLNCAVLEYRRNDFGLSQLIAKTGLVSKHSRQPFLTKTATGQLYITDHIPGPVGQKSTWSLCSQI